MSRPLHPDEPCLPILSHPHTRRVNLVLALALLLLLGWKVDSPPSVILADRIEQIVTGTQARSAFWGIYVQDVTTGRVLYSLNEDKTLMPASNQKIITTATALAVLGSDYRYETTLRFDGEIDGAVLRGDLIIEGSGDPTFGSRKLGGEDPLRGWAQQLADMGITRVEGRIIGDDNVFDDDGYPAGWDVTHIATESFAPASGGLSYHDNLIDVHLAATSPGRLMSIRDDPPGYLDIRNKAVTGTHRRRQNPNVHRPVGTESLVLSGTASATYRGRIQLPISDPTAFTLHSFAHYLHEAGIGVTSELHDIDDLPGAFPTSKAEPLFVHTSPPLSEIIAVINKESNNFYAEQVFNTFGWGGTNRGSERRVKQLLVELGIRPDGLSIRDGSGLSRKDMITPEAMAQLLTRMYEHEERDAFMASLAQGGERRTTLHYRLRGRPVQAKTGSLEYVRALSGYATTPDGRPVAFVLLANNYTVPSYRIMQALDQIAEAIMTTQLG